MLKRLLVSVAGQSVRDFEVIVVDDGSPERSDYQMVANEFRTVFKEFTYLRNTNNRGANASRNIGIRNSRYEFLAFVDDDDEWMPGKIERQLTVFHDADRSLGIVYTWADARDEADTLIYTSRGQIEGNAIKEILDSCFMLSPTVMVRKAAILEAGYFDERLVSCQDWDMWTRIFLLGYTCSVVREVLAVYRRQKEGSIGSSTTASKGYNQYYRKHFRKIMRHAGIRRKAAVLVFFVRYYFRSIVSRTDVF